MSDAIEHDAAPAAGGVNRPWPLWEVFVRPARGLSHTHAGSLHAADAQMKSLIRAASRPVSTVDVG